jgi:hypothetical protein
MMQEKKVFFDTEFTGLHKDTTLISIGLIADTGETFYAELNDYYPEQVDEWVQQNVISKLIYTGLPEGSDYYRSWTEHNHVGMRGNRQEVARYLADWFQALLGGPMSWIEYSSVYPPGREQNKPTLIEEPLIEMWSDCLSYDWVLFNDLWGSAFDIPKCVYYIPFDICTYFKLNGMDPDISREEYVGMMIVGNKHNALYDAKTIKLCHEKLSEADKSSEKCYNEAIWME